MKKTIAVVWLFAASLCVEASPTRSNLGASGVGFTSEAESPIAAYVQDGLAHMFDGMLSAKEYGAQLESSSSENTGVWDDIVAGSKMMQGVIGTGEEPYQTCYKHGSRAHIFSFYFLMDQDFTLHGVLEMPIKAVWFNWCIFGVGKGDGLQNGIVLDGQGSTPTVKYRKSYNGTVLNSIPLTGLKYGTTIAYTLVFHYDTKTFEVYVNGEYKGESTILAENWNLDGANTILGTNYYELNTTYNANTKVYEVMWYKKALSADEITQNFSVDKERWGFWE